MKQEQCSIAAARQKSLEILRKAEAERIADAVRKVVANTSPDVRAMDYMRKYLIHAEYQDLQYLGLSNVGWIVRFPGRAELEAECHGQRDKLLYHDDPAAAVIAAGEWLDEQET